MSDGPAELLGELRQLQRKARHDRHGYAFPLLVFAALLLIAPVVYWSRPDFPLSPDGTYEVVTVQGPFPVFESPYVRFGGNNLVVAWFWMLGLIACFAISAWWYRRRAEVAGVETDTRGFLVVAGAALFGMAFGMPLLEQIVGSGLYSQPEINLPIMIGSAAVAAVAAMAGARWKHLRVAGTAAAALFTAISFSSIAVYMINGLGALLIIAGAVLTLAWVERSLLLAVIGVLFTAASLHANLEGMTAFFGGRDTRLNLLMDVGPAAAVLIIGGVIALVFSRRATG